MWGPKSLLKVWKVSLCLLIPRYLATFMLLLITQKHTNPSKEKAVIDITSVPSMKNGKRMAKAFLVKSLYWLLSRFCQESGPRTVVDTCNSNQVQAAYNSVLRRDVVGEDLKNSTFPLLFSLYHMFIFIHIKAWNHKHEIAHSSITTQHNLYLVLHLLL